MTSFFFGGLQKDFGIVIALGIAFIIIGSICFHEICHVVAAHYQGDDTAIEQGYLTFNPLKLMGIISLIVFFFAGIAWGAVPVDPRRFRNRWSDLVISLAGPGANLLLFVIFMIAATSLFDPVAFNESRHHATNDLVKMICAGQSAPFILFFHGSFLNLALLIFNLLPVPMLDGFAIVRHFFPNVLRSMEKSNMMQIVYVVMIFLLFSLSGFLFLPRATGYCNTCCVSERVAAR